jgi:hypothetical protein
MRLNLLCVFVIVLSIIFPVSQASGVGSNTYSFIGLKILEPDPVICMMEPHESIQPIFWEAGFTDSIMSASQEWVTIMKKETGGNWDFHYQFYFWEEHKNKAPSDFKQCNVFILFHNEYRGSELGYTSYSYSNSNHKYAIISIHTTVSVSHIDVGEYGNVIVEDIPLKLCVINKTMLHEFGHILGLGHYHNPYEKYSIMTPFLDYRECNDERVISGIDIYMLKMLYGNDGFEIRDNPIGLDKTVIIG